ncbi:MAG: DEAD/DEAH box helicase [Candidatus Gastranaerophilales bacterium]|nr:DEAD/DEAH box helicase [Candidatus Gastranaerophilales bacterium]
MRISKISYPISGNNIKLSKQKYSSIPLLENKNINTISKKRAEYPRYYTQIPFGSNEKQAGVVEEYFKLPEGCKPDDFQIESGRSIEKGNDLIADAPTGTGKTAIAHYAVSKNMEEGKKTFYTTPLKALSNQKYNEFKSVYGDDNVGILTGDRRENSEAPILIMTTEVYRNMALSNMYGETSDLMKNLKTVILDEFHYLDDADRGTVWEEAKMYTPQDVQTVALSATFGNPEELIGWFNNNTSRNADLVSLPSEKRHVPLVFNSITTGSYKDEEKRIKKGLRRGTVSQSDGIPPRASLSDFKYAVEKLDEKQQLPAIFFVFSRKYSRELLDYLNQEGQDLTTVQEKKEIEEIINKHENKHYIGADLDREALKKGYAIHNAGIIPGQKELIEELFQKKLIKTVIATETLAAGINMPAKTVVISNLYKPDDNSDDEYGMRMLTANEFKQMSGRAGRRGIDTVGYVYMMPTDRKSEQDFLYLEAIDCNPLTSKYDPSYDFLAGYYEYYDDNKKLSDIFNKTFFVYSENDSEKKSKVQSLADISDKKTNVLLDCGILNSDDEGRIYPTEMSNIASKIRGYDVLTLTETIADKNTFSNISPQALAMVMGAIANPASSGEKDINYDTDLQYVFCNAAEGTDKIYDRLNQSVNSMLRELGKNTASFNNYQEMLEFAESIEKPEDSPEHIKSELKNQSARRAKMYTITQKSGNYTLSEIVQALKDHDVVPSKVLEKYSEVLEKYKSGINQGSISEYIEKLEMEAEKQDTSKKGNKTKARLERKKSELYEEITKAKLMQYLDENLFEAMGANYQFIKKNPPSKVKQDFYNAEALYFKSTLKDILVDKLTALIALQENTEQEIISAEDTVNDSKKVKDCFKNLKNKSLETCASEIKNGIVSSPERYNETAAEILYTWVYLNRINPEDTMTNWEQLLRIIPENSADEGTIYRTIMQTADLLSQIMEVSEAGYISSKNEDDKLYYSELKETAKEARNLMIKKPIEI